MSINSFSLVRLFDALELNGIWLSKCNCVIITRHLADFCWMLAKKGWTLLVLLHVRHRNVFYTLARRTFIYVFLGKWCAGSISKQLSLQFGCEMDLNFDWSNVRLDKFEVDYPGFRLFVASYPEREYGFRCSHVKQCNESKGPNLWLERVRLSGYSSYFITIVQVY